MRILRTVLLSLSLLSVAAAGCASGGSRQAHNCNREGCNCGHGRGHGGGGSEPSSAAPVAGEAPAAAPAAATAQPTE